MGRKSFGWEGRGVLGTNTMRPFLHESGSGCCPLNRAVKYCGMRSSLSSASKYLKPSYVVPSMPALTPDLVPRMARRISALVTSGATSTWCTDRTCRK